MHLMLTKLKMKHIDNRLYMLKGFAFVFNFRMKEL